MVDPFDDQDAPMEDEFEAYEDFEEAEEPPKIKTASGMDTFCIIASFFIMLGAAFLVGWGVLYDVYDSRLGGIMPAKKYPIICGSKVDVMAFGRDDHFSNVYNYCYVNAGRASGLLPGMILWIEKDAKIVTLVVSDQLGANWARCDITDINPPVTFGAPSAGQPIADQPPPADGATPAAQPMVTQPIVNTAKRPLASSWHAIDNKSEAAVNLPLLLSLDSDGKSTLKAYVAPWKEQKYHTFVEDKIAKNPRRPPTKRGTKKK